MATRQSIGMGNGSHLGGPPYWLFYPAVLLAVGFLFLISRAEPLLAGLVPFGVLIVALGGICFQAFRWRRTASVCAVIVLAMYWVPLFVILLTMTTRIASGIVLFVYFAIYLIPVSVFAGFATASFSRRAGTGWAGSALILALVPCVVMTAIADHDRASKYSRRAPEPADPLALRTDFLLIDKCTWEFAKQDPKEGFPESLAQLGPQGSGCLPDDVAKGVKGEFSIRYEPGTHLANEAVKSYSVAAAETVSKSKSTATIYSSEEGLIWLHYDGPDVHPRPSLIYYPGTDFYKLEACLWEGAVGTSWRIFEGDELKTLTDRNLSVNHCLTGTTTRPSGALTVGDYQYEFRFLNGSDGPASGFEASIRPASYGVTGLRSYFAVETLASDGKRQRLVVHATPENRAATDQDPLALPDEVSMPTTLHGADEEWCGDKLCE